MALDHDTMINPPIEQLLDTVDSKFTLVTLAARRARNINSYFNQLGDGLGHMIPPQVSSVARKPLSIAFEEIAQDKIRWTEAPQVAEESDARGVGRGRGRERRDGRRLISVRVRDDPPIECWRGHRCSQASASCWG
jgi:DNA-directed RNA polymerase subunit omega